MTAAVEWSVRPPLPEAESDLVVRITEFPWQRRETTWTSDPVSRPALVEAKIPVLRWPSTWKAASVRRGCAVRPNRTHRADAPDPCWHSPGRSSLDDSAESHGRDLTCRKRVIHSKEVHCQTMTVARIFDVVADVVGSLAWPTVVLIALLMLRPHLDKLNWLETIRYKGFQMDFKRVVEEATEKGEALEAKDGDEPDLDPQWLKLLETDPQMAFLRSWIDVETAIDDLANAHLDLPQPLRRIPTRRKVRRLAEAGVIDPSLGGLLDEMQYARNLIVHGRDIHLRDKTIRDFAKAASRVAAIVEQQLDV